MAVATRRTKLHGNPARRRMTPRQIKFFGTPRQKAALKNSRRMERLNAARRRKPKSHRRRSLPKRRNAGEIISLALAPTGNPSASKKRRTHMAKAKRKSGARRSRRRSNPRRRYSYARSRSRGHRRRSLMSNNPNPSRRRRSNRRRRRSNPYHRRRNPGLAGSVGGFMTGALYTIGGGVGTRMLTQAVLGASNTGWMGYGANLAAAFVLGGATQWITRNRNARNFVILGGVISTLLRVLTDLTPFGRRLALSGMGDYLVQGFLTPQRLINGLHTADIEYPPQVQPVVLSSAAAPEGGIEGLGRYRLIG